jgi:hypothetical protein
MSSQDSQELQTNEITDEGPHETDVPPPPQTQDHLLPMAQLIRLMSREGIDTSTDSVTAMHEHLALTFLPELIMHAAGLASAANTKELSTKHLYQAAEERFGIMADEL